MKRLKWLNIILNKTCKFLSLYMATGIEIRSHKDKNGDGPFLRVVEVRGAVFLEIAVINNELVVTAKCPELISIASSVETEWNSR